MGRIWSYGRQMVISAASSSRGAHMSSGSATAAEICGCCSRLRLGDPMRQGHGSSYGTIHSSRGILLLAAGLAGREEWLQRITQDPGQFHASFAIPLRLLGLAVILYVAARAIGRVFDGFAPSHRSGASESSRAAIREARRLRRTCLSCPMSRLRATAKLPA